MPSIAPLRQDARNQDQQDRSNQEETPQDGIQGDNVSAEPSQAAAVGPRPPTPAETIRTIPFAELNAIFNIFESNPVLRSAPDRENVVRAVRASLDPAVSVNPNPSQEEPPEFVFTREELEGARPRLICETRAQQIIDYIVAEAQKKHSQEETDNNPRVKEFYRLPVEVQARFISQTFFLLDDIVPRGPLPDSTEQPLTTEGEQQ